MVLGLTTRLLIVFIVCVAVSLAQTIGQWDYSEVKDEMGRGTGYLATLRSANVADIGPPYHEVPAILKLQKGGGEGSSAALQIEHASLISSAPLTVRFDEGNAQQFEVVSTTDYKTDRVGIVGAGYRRFIAQLRHAHKLRIEATLFQAGARVFEFDVGGLRSSW
jgi:hypothetical protein